MTTQEDGAVGEERIDRLRAAGMPPVAAATSRDRGAGPFRRLVLRGATVIDGTGAPPWSPADIVIENGRITKGAPSLVGRHIDSLEVPEEAPPELKGSKRQQAGQKAAKTRTENEREAHYQRAVWAKKAKKEGIEPKHLHQLAADRELTVSDAARHLLNIGLKQIQATA